MNLSILNNFNSILDRQLTQLDQTNVANVINTIAHHCFFDRQ